MPAQIQPTRLDVTDRFPMVAFRIRADGNPRQAEVAIGTEPGLFTFEGKKNRTAANFYSTHGNGGARFAGSEASFTVPPEVLARFVGNERLYFGLATAGEDGAMKVAVSPTAASPYISIKGLSERSMARVRVLPSRQQRAAGYGRGDQAQLEWAGDIATPGIAPVANGAAPDRAAVAANGKGPAPAAAPAPYDDGFGPMPDDPPARPPAGVVAPAAEGLAYSPVRALAEQPIAVTPPSVSIPGTLARIAIETGISAAAGPLAPLLTTLKTAANALGCSVGLGPQVGAGLGAGGQLGVGIIFGKDGDLGIYGAAEIDIGFITSISGTAVVTIVKGAIDEFGGWTSAFAIAGGEGVVGGAAVLLNDRGDFVGISANVGIGVGFSPIDFYFAAQRGWATRVMALAQSMAGTAPARADASPNGRGVVNRYTGRRVAGTKTLGTGDRFTLNWDDVQLIAQPTDVTCWAAAAAMLIGWRDQVSIAPETIAEITGRSTASGLRTTDNETFAAETGLTPVPAACYSADAFRGLLADYGPLWVSEGTPPNRHAVLVTGMYSDGADTYVRISDPWDRAVGMPGSPGPYASTHATGSRYIMRWDDFAAAYEQLATSSPLNSRILHAGGSAGRVPNTGEATPPGYAQSYDPVRRPAARGLAGAESFTLNWDEVQLVPQSDDMGCWAAAAAMVIGWRDQISLSPEAVRGICGRTGSHGLDLPQTEAFAREMGLSFELPACYTVDGLRGLLASKGPLWVGAARPGPHVVVVTGMYSDGVDTFVRIADPWDRVVGSPGVPGPALATHTTGSRYIMRFEDFIRSYEQAATFPDVTLQILHSGGVGLRQPNRGPTTPPGYAMSANGADEGADGDVLLPAPPPPRARAMSGAEAAIAIGGFLLETVRDSAGDVSWELDQFRERKHPDDVTPASPAPYHDAPTIRLDQWPVSGGLIDDISAWFSIDWQYNGRSLGNVRITNVGTNDAVGWSLHVRAQIMDDNILYEPGGCAALRVRFHYRFSRGVGSDHIALTDLHLYGDGTHEIASQWVQADALSMAQSSPPARVLELGKVGEIVLGRLLGPGDVKWQLDSFTGPKHPRDTAPANPSPYRNAPTIRIRDWERGMIFDCSADFDIDWQYNGVSIGPIDIKNVGFDDSVAWNLSVRATISHDNIVYDNRAAVPILLNGLPRPLLADDDTPAVADMTRQPCAAMRVRFDFDFTQWPVGPPHKGAIDIILFGDGTHVRHGRWLQTPFI